MSEELLIDNDIYLKAGIHIGTKFKTKYMEKFIYKTRPDGLSVLNLEEIDKRIAIAGKFLANYNPEDIVFISRREGSFKALEQVEKLLGCKVFKGRYPPGLFTNPELKNFLEPKLVVLSDPTADKSALDDAYKAGITTIAFCDTNNQTNFVDLVIPCNNKGKKSLGLLYYLLIREYMVNKGMVKKDEFKPTVEDFTEE